MQRHALDPGVFIRSVATRGYLGGLSRSTFDVAHVLDAMGFQRILIETVGVGQDEVDVMRAAHTTVVVSVPGLGDDIQAIKAGLLEIADVLVVNKADREGADRTERDLMHMLELRAGDRGGRDRADDRDAWHRRGLGHRRARRRDRGTSRARVDRARRRATRDRSRRRAARGAGARAARRAAHRRCSRTRGSPRSREDVAHAAIHGRSRSRSSTPTACRRCSRASRAPPVLGASARVLDSSRLCVSRLCL